MHRRVLIAVWATAFVATLCLAQEGRKPPKKPDQPFKVFVYTEGLKNEDVDMPAVAEEVAKRIGKKKKWLKVVKAREEASVIVEVLTHVMNEQFRTKIDMRVDDQGIGKHYYDDHFVSERHRIETRITLPDGTQKLFTGADERDRGGSMKRAASHLAEQLEEHVKDHYWDFVSS